MTQNKNIEEIKNNKIFQGVSPSVFKGLNVKSFIGVKEGDIIFQSGDESQSLFLIVEGEVKVKLSVSRYSEVVVRKKNDFFGEKEILEKSKRVSSAVANTDSILFVIDSKNLKKLISIDKNIKENLFKQGEEEHEGTDEDDDFNISDPQDENDFQDTLTEEIEEAAPEEGINTEEELKNDLDHLKEDEAADDIRYITPEAGDDYPVNTIIEEKDFPVLSEKEIEKIEEEINRHEEELTDITHDKNIVDHIESPPVKKDPLEGIEPEDNLSWDFENAELMEEDEPVDYEVPLNIPIEIPDDLEDETTAGVEPPSSEESIALLTSAQLRLIIEAAQKVNSELQIDKVLNSIVEAACSLTGADRGTLYIVDKENNQIWSKALSGGQLKEIRLQIGEGIAGAVAANNEIVNLNDVQNDMRFNAEYDRATGYTTKSMLSFPINNKEGEAVAVLQLLNSSKGEFTKLDEDLLSAISVNAALALENAGLVEKLLQKDRMSSLGKMASFLIQDIKRPILTIKHYAEHIKKKNVPNDIKQVLDMLTDQANTIITLVTSTLSYSEGKSLLQTQEVKLSDAMDDILSLLAEYVESRKVKLFKKFEADAVINLDTKEFYQACFQITKNACDSMPGGGNIYITVLKDVEGQIKIDFKDQGLGIPSSLIDRIFDPFMSHGKKNGTGLGLSIAEKIVKDHGGYITVESDLGEGAVFTIHLPAEGQQEK